MTKVKLHTTMAGANGCHMAGDIVSVDEGYAKILVDGGYASYLNGKGEATRNELETAAIRNNLETAMKPKAVKKSRQHRKSNGD